MTERHDDPARAFGEEFRRRSAARDDRLCGRASDGAGGRRADRGCAHGERSPERINHRNGYRDRVWETRAGTVELKIPKLRKGSYFPRLPGAAPDGGEGAHGGDPGGLHPGRVDPLGRRPGAGDGHDRHLQEPEPAPAKAGGPRLCAEIDDKIEELPRAPAGGRVALSLARCHLCEGARGRAHRPGRGHRRVVAVTDQGRREVLGMAIGASEAETFWTDFLRSLTRRGLERRQAGGLRRPQGAQGRRHPHPRCHLAKMPHPLHAQPAGPLPAARAGASSPPSSPPPSPRTTPRPQAPSGAWSPTSSDPRRPSSPPSWTTPSTTCWPT